MNSYRRVVVKAGTNVLTSKTQRLDQEVIARLVEQLALLHKEGIEVLLVTSGAIAIGRQVLDYNLSSRDVPSRQVLASIGQSHLMHIYQECFSKYDLRVAQALITKEDISHRQGYLNIRNTLNTLLEKRIIPIINENDVVEISEIQENIIGDNDSLSALVTNLVDADLLIMLTDTDGLYTADPKQNKAAQLINKVSVFNEEINKLASTEPNPMGRGGIAAKIAAAKLVTSSGSTAVIAPGLTPNVLMKIIQGVKIGTIFLPAGSRLESRQRWLISKMSASKSISIDPGALKALKTKTGSLLPAGVTKVTGSFDRGTIIGIKDDTNNTVGCGIANYSSRDLKSIMGLHSRSIMEQIGHSFGEESIHRNNMVVF